MYAGQWYRYLVAQGFPVVHVEIPSEDRATWKLTCAPGTPQATIDAATTALRTAPLPDVAAALKDDEALDALEAITGKAVKATVLWTLRRVLGQAPTPAQVATARQEWVAIFKALP